MRARTRMYARGTKATHVRTHDVVALEARELDDGELRVDGRAAHDDALDLDHRLQVHL